MSKGAESDGEPRELRGYPALPGSCRRPDPERVILDPTYLNPRPNDHDGILIEPDEFERNGKQYVRYSVR
ncbi:C2H2 type master regulator of conidiophore development brlA [Fusarium oxysporum f. sp. albedinis]|nr:C2H2 type master regulator of conidiophore development brlA [Fusarium oxysporum f. sp. albedinis]